MATIEELINNKDEFKEVKNAKLRKKRMNQISWSKIRNSHNLCAEKETKFWAKKNLSKKIKKY